ncbi:sodium-dependent bicarbonate transport family permease [Rickettsiales endosymbiont of Stachyamoeba lipophora]|uniref:sodium-dependent bicarbonate transport family permease n=1 Tax=Rickettsiales endosymbiont of Stachyamoeba lipophora TaxID=2486578 RepID=UPI000F65516F|nr:sodium-dependent bicarbonate transport family permease [Rickettsiales endosymbiont of Stachyamoeba lipophora]AZL15587.1 sodium-dependent bicarbonate transport family permease [Rickettsiales endosymbiont of Stachyamoeba lipophora]
MDLLSFIHVNLLNPAIMCFILGIIATIFKSNLSLPDVVYDAIAIYLLLAIGIKGGIKIASSDLSNFTLPVFATIAIALLTTFIAFFLLKLVGKLDFINSAAIAAHYGSVSVVTFMAAISFLQIMQIEYEPFMTALVAILEVPSIIIALCMVYIKRSGKISHIFKALRKALSTKSLILLIGGITIGMTMDKNHTQDIKYFFETPFKGVLCLFLLQKGIVAATKFHEIRKIGSFLIIFNLAVPIPFALIGIYLGKLCGLSLGGGTLLGVMAASSSYIAVPAAMKASLPEASPTLSLVSTLGINVPFNIIFGIGIYFTLAQIIYS